MKPYFLAAITMATVVAAPATAQVPDVHFNEIYVSHAGVDDQEFIELIGAPGTSLNGIVVAIVEGEDPVAGNLDRVIDLTGEVIPLDGYFVIGDAAVDTVFGAGTNDLTFALPDNNIENGSETFYLIEENVPGDLANLVDTDVSATPTTTILGTLGTILDCVGMKEPDDSGGDLLFSGDGCPIKGPDLAGPFFPAGIFRTGDYPNDWCADVWLDFDDVANANVPRTPGAANNATPCTCILTWTDIGFGKAGSSGSAPVLNGTGDLTANSLNSVDLTNALPNSQTALIVGFAILGVPFKGGTMCPTTNFIFAGFPTDGAGAFSLPFVWPAGVPAGFNLYWQHWVTDGGVSGNLAASNCLESTTP